MAGLWQANSYSDDAWFPVWVGLAVVAILVLVFIAINSIAIRKAAGARGSQHVVSSGGVVRRSSRSVRKPTRFEPNPLGQGESSPSPKSPSPLTPTIEKVSKAMKSPRKMLSDTLETVKASVETPTEGKGRGRGRPKKTPSAASPAVSPARRRTRSTKSP